MKIATIRGLWVRGSADQVGECLHRSWRKQLGARTQPFAGEANRLFAPPPRAPAPYECRDGVWGVACNSRPQGRCPGMIERGRNPRPAPSGDGARPCSAAAPRRARWPCSGQTPQGDAPDSAIVLRSTASQLAAIADDQGRPGRGRRAMRDRGGERSPNPRRGCCCWCAEPRHSSRRRCRFTANAGRLRESLGCEAPGYKEFV